MSVDATGYSPIPSCFVDFALPTQTEPLAQPLGPTSPWGWPDLVQKFTFNRYVPGIYQNSIFEVLKIFHYKKVYYSLKLFKSLWRYSW